MTHRLRDQRVLADRRERRCPETRDAPLEEGRGSRTCATSRRQPVSHVSRADMRNSPGTFPVRSSTKPSFDLARRTSQERLAQGKCTLQRVGPSFLARQRVNFSPRACLFCRCVHTEKEGGKWRRKKGGGERQRGERALRPGHGNAGARDEDNRQGTGEDMRDIGQTPRHEVPHDQRPSS